MRAAESLREVRLRPEVRVEEIPAPQRIAPHTLALTAEATRPDLEEPLATGRFVLLHDPAGPEAWESTWRAVTYVRAELEPELGTDPLLGEVGWSWLEDAFEGVGVGWRALGGTVTRVVSDGFGALSERPSTVEMEIRASWSPLDEAVGDHLRVWAELLCTIAGLPPLPDGVSALPGRR